MSFSCTSLLFCTARNTGQYVKDGNHFSKFIYLRNVPWTEIIPNFVPKTFKNVRRSKCSAVLFLPVVVINGDGEAQPLRLSPLCLLWYDQGTVGKKVYGMDCMNLFEGFCLPKKKADPVPIKLTCCC